MLSLTFNLFLHKTEVSLFVVEAVNFFLPFHHKIEYMLNSTTMLHTCLLGATGLIA